MPDHEAEPALHAPDLSPKQERQAEESAAIPAPVLHETIRRQGEEEMERPASSLAWSGLAAGLSMGFSLVAEGVIKAALPETSWAPLVSKLGYSVGFLIVILGRQQLFTENTLTAVLPVMARRGGRTLARMLRLWTVVLVANLLGAFLMALALAHTNVFDDHIRQTFDEIGRRAIAHDFLTILIKGVFAGWLIALTVWVLPASAASKFPIILVLTWLVGAAELSHIIAGSVETMYLAARGETTWARCLLGYMLPTLIGNTIGGVALVAGVNHAQVVGERKSKPHHLAQAGA